MNRLFTAAVATALIVIMMTAQSFAAEDYSYKMRVSAGNNGEFLIADGSTATEVVYRIGADSGEAFPEIGTANVRVTNDKYVVVGFREAGRDTIMATVPAATTEKSDKSYVAVYGIRSSLVRYTVRYLDADGSPLMADAVYYGPAGSQVMVSFKYIEGYAPTAYNLTKTLTENADENVLAFRYYESDLTAEEQTDNVDNTAANAAGTAAVPAAAAPAANPAAAQAAAIDAATPGTPEVVNLDEGDVPLAGPDEEDGEEANGSSGLSPAAIAAILAALALVIGITAAILKRRESEDEDEAEEEAGEETSEDPAE